jgi:hypothetical protein
MTRIDFNQLLSSINGLTPQQMRRLRQQLDERLSRPRKPTAPTSGKAAERAKPAATKEPKKKMTEAEFAQHLLKIGLVSSLPDPALDIDDDDPDDQPVTIKGEPLSETIIRERR